MKHSEWLQAARRSQASDLPRLFANLTSGSAPEANERIAALAPWPASSALVHNILALFEAPPYTAVRSQPLWTHALAILVRANAPVEPTLQRVQQLSARCRELFVAENMGSWMADKLAVVERVLERRLYELQPLDQSDAQEALLSGDAAATLPSLLEAWRLCRDPELADLIDVIGSRQDDGVLSKLATIKTAPKLRKVLHDLLQRPPDPRVASAVVSLVSAPPVPLFRSAFVELCGAVVVHGDPRCLAPLQRLAATRAELAHLVRIASDLAPSLSLPETSRETLRRVIAACQTGSTDAGPEQDLLAAIFADPQNDAPRLVYADWLLAERGDDRGELIALQIAAEGAQRPPPDSRTQRRINALAKKHKAAMLGDLGAVVVKKTARLRRGFLHSCEIQARDDDTCRALFGHPAWATVERLSYREHSCQGLVASESMRSLRQAFRLCPEEVIALGQMKTPPPLESIEIAMPPTPGPRLRGPDEPPFYAAPPLGGLVSSIPTLRSVWASLNTLLGMTYAYDRDRDLPPLVSALETHCAQMEEVGIRELPGYLPFSPSAILDRLERARLQADVVGAGSDRVVFRLRRDAAARFSRCHIEILALGTDPQTRIDPYEQILLVIDRVSELTLTLAPDVKLSAEQLELLASFPTRDPEIAFYLPAVQLAT